MNIAIEAIARVCHEANKGLCESFGDFTQKTWEEAEQWQKDAISAGVKEQISNPDITPEQSHVAWCEVKYASGWVYGPVKNAEKKTHPCLVPYSHLPYEERAKDYLRIAVIKSFLP